MACDDHLVIYEKQLPPEQRSTLKVMSIDALSCTHLVGTKNKVRSVHRDITPLVAQRVGVASRVGTGDFAICIQLKGSKT